CPQPQPFPPLPSPRKPSTHVPPAAPLPPTSPSISHPFPHPFSLITPKLTSTISPDQPPPTTNRETPVPLTELPPRLLQPFPAPIGGGLSSSASFEVATALALLHANKSTLSPEATALACVWAEHHYPGVPCGIMDQFVSTMGRQAHALLLDCRDRSTRHVPL